MKDKVKSVRIALPKCNRIQKIMIISFLLIGQSFSSLTSENVYPRQRDVEHAVRQKNTVTGKIVDDQGNPVIGANVVESGTTNGTITDSEGNFTLTVQHNAMLQITYIGYLSQQIDTAGKTHIGIVLQEDAQALDEVVVVGYGTQKKVNLTGAVSSINYSDEAKNRPITTVSNALAGLAAGVQVMQGSGEPGSDGAGITIRGLGTLNSSSPLILIDGMATDMNILNPQDIESISILKDAASSAIYGARAANGVILVTTKKGNKGKTSVNYSNRMLYNQPTNLLNFVSNYADYMELINESRTNINQASLFAQTTIDLWREKSKNPDELNENGIPNYVSFPNTDWLDVIFTHGITHDHSLSVNGGSDLFRYYMSIGYQNNPGIVKNTGIKKYTLRSNLESNLNKWLVVGLRLFGRFEDKDPADFSQAISYISQITPGVYPEYMGQLGYAEASEESGATTRNLLQRLYSREGYFRDTFINSTFYSRISFLRDFSYELSLNYERRIEGDRTYTNSIDLVRLSDGQVMLPGDTPENMTTYFFNSDRYNYTIENLLRFRKIINSSHDLEALLGYEEYYYYLFNNNATKQGLIDQSINVPSAATTMVSIGGASTENASRSLFGRFNYSFKSRYLLEANLRYDGSSRFDKESRWGLFPSFSAGWNISKENFMNGTHDWLDLLKIRTSWGQLGNNSVGDYPYQSTYSITNAVINSTLVAGLSATSIPNSLLTWETTTVRNIGIESKFLNNRLQMETDFYKKVTDGILYRPTIYMTLGNKTAPMMNIAEVTNKGLELYLKWQDRIRDFSYSISGNFAYNHNEVTKYQGKYEAGWVTDSNENRVWTSNIGDVSTGDDMRVLEGKVISEFYMAKPYRGTGTYYNEDGTVDINGGPRDGMIRTTEDMTWLQAMMNVGYTFMPYQTIAKDKIWFGDMIYADVNGDGIYGNSYDQEFQGASNVPKINFGFSIQASYKAFDFSCLWAGATGFYRYSTAYTKTSTGVGYAINKEIADDHYFYDPDNPDDPRTNIYAKYGRLTQGSSFQNLARSTMYLFKGDYLKLKNITIGYSLPNHLLNKLTLQNARIFLSGDNLLNFNKFPGMDSEIGASPKYPTIKTYAIGINVNF